MWDFIVYSEQKILIGFMDCKYLFFVSDLCQCYFNKWPFVLQ